MSTHHRDGLSSKAVRTSNWKGLWAWVRHDLLKEVIRGLLGILPPRPIEPPAAYHARDRFGRWELRVMAKDINEPSPDQQRR